MPKYAASSLSNFHRSGKPNRHYGLDRIEPIYQYTSKFDKAIGELDIAALNIVSEHCGKSPSCRKICYDQATSSSTFRATNEEQALEFIHGL